MKFDDGLIAEAAALAKEHRQMLDRLPVTVRASLMVELHKWATLFPAERKYQGALLAHLSGVPRADADRMFAGIVKIEADAGVRSIGAGDPGRFQDEAQALLRKKRLLYQWRGEIEKLFQQIDPVLNGQLYPADAPRRLVVQLYGSGISIQTDKLWERFKGSGFRIPLKLEDGAGAGAGADGFLRGLFGENAASVTSGIESPLESWFVETGDGLSKFGEAGTTLSYARLRGYRDELTRALYDKVQKGVQSPQAFAAYARSLKIAPGAGVFPHGADVMQAFVRDVFLTGSGTLFVNNTFVEWAAVQALKRAQPRMLVARYGVRDKMKPFSSLLLFSQPRATDQIPEIEDPTGSFVDVEQLSYYVWLNAEKTPAYRNRTLYLFLAEGVDEMLAVRSDLAGTASSPSS
ncbi:MAG TPA: hypothetical protein VF215_01595, partial [Thermoanaerobaculia bacterium]